MNEIEMMPVMIDTNIIYTLAGMDDQNPKYNSEIVKNEIAKMTKVFYSEISLYDIFTNSNLTMNEKNKIYSFLKTNYGEPVKAFGGIEPFEKILTEGKIKDIKIYEEAITLRGCLNFITYTFYYYQYLSLGTTSKQTDFTISMSRLLMKDLDTDLQECIKILDDYYSSRNNSKERIDQFINSKLQKANEIFNIIEENESVEKTISHFKLDKSKLKKSLSFVETVFKNLFPEYLSYVRYYCLCTENYFSKGKRFEKNNLFDSWFHLYDTQFTVITLDKFLIESYRAHDQHSYLSQLLWNVKNIEKKASDK